MTTTNVNVKSSQQSENFKDTLMKYTKYWYLFLITIAISLIAAYAYLTYATPRYKVSSTLLIQDDKKGEGSLLKGTAFSDLNMFQTAKTVDNEMEILRSRDLIYKVLKGLSLETSYFEEGIFKSKELYGENLPFQVAVYQLGPKAYIKNIKITILSDSTYLLEDGTQKQARKFGDKIIKSDYVISLKKGPAFALSSKIFDIHFNNLYKRAEAYSKANLSIMPIIKDANTITLSLVDNIPQRGIDILTNLINDYNLQNVNNKNIMALNTIKFIDNRLKYLVNDLSDVEGDVENYKQQNMVTDIGLDAQMAMAKSGEYNQLLASSDVQLGIINSLESYFKSNSKDDQHGLVPSTLGIKDPTLNTLTTKYNELQLQRSQLLRSSTPDNPLVQNIDSQLANVKSSIQENLNNIKQGFIIERNNLRANSSKFSSKIKSSPVIERGLLARTREQSVKSGLYRYLLQKREETELSLSATIPTSQIVDKPAYNSNPESPKKPLIYLCAFLLGCLLPTAVIYGKEVFNTKIKDASAVELITGARILGELSHNDNDEAVVIQRDSRSTISELFRYIRINLGFMNVDQPNKVMLVTSSMKGEGKTFFSINLGMTLAMLDKKVVILEFDLRKPDVLKNIGINTDLGITDFIKSDKIQLDDIIIPSGLNPNLFVIGCGTIPENPAELMTDPKIQQLFESLKERFDYIITDTSPVGQVADAFSLANHADVSIYLVRYNYTNKLQLGILQDICNNKKLKNPMVVFNDAKKENRPAYGYGGWGYPLEKVN